MSLPGGDTNDAQLLERNKKYSQLKYDKDEVSRKLESVLQENQSLKKESDELKSDVSLLMQVRPTF